MIRADDRVIGKVSGINGLVGRCTNVIGTGNKRRYTIAFDNGSVRDVAKRSIDLFTSTTTSNQLNSGTGAVAAPTTVNIVDDDNEEDNNSNFSDSDSNDSDKSNDTSR